MILGHGYREKVGKGILKMKTEKKEGRWEGLRSFRTLFPYLRSYKKWLFVGILSLAIVDALQLCIPLIIKWAVDDLTEGRATSAVLLSYAGWILLLAVGIGGFRYLWRMSLMTPTRRIEKRLRNRLFQHILSMSEDFFMRHSSGDLMARMVNDLNMIRMAVGFGMVGMMDAFVMGSATLVFMIWISRSLTLYILIPMPFLVLSTALISRRIHFRAQKVQKQFSALTEAVREGISGIRVIRAYKAEPFQESTVKLEGEKLLQENLALAKVRGIFFPVLMLLVNLSMVLVLYFGGKDTILARISPGDFVAFTNYLMLLTWPMMAMGWVISLIQRGAASLTRINEILDSRPSIQSTPRAPLKDEVSGELRVENVAFSYDPRQWVLKDCSLTVERGKMTAIVGEIGCGKTTLLLLMMRVFDPREGVLRLGDRDIRDFDVAEYRGLFAYVSQEPVIFSQTLFENIAFGQSGITEYEVEKALRTVQLWEEVAGFPEGIKTLVGEKGVTLSGGQRQRVALARALLSKRPFLVLDAPFSSVDVSTEQKILEAIRSEFGGITLIMSSQRVASFMKADRIFMMEGGKVCASGSHQDLMEQSEAYRALIQEITLGIGKR